MSPEQTEQDEQGDLRPDRAPEGSARRPHGYGKPGWVVLRAVIVLVIAGVGYQEVIPVTHVERARLARLAVRQPGIKEFDVKPTNAGAQSAAASGLKALVAAAKKSPNSTGLYAIEWVGKSQQDAAQVAVFLTPSQADARQVYAELATVSLGAKAESSSSLTRLSTYTVPGLPGSTGSLFGMTTKTGSTPDLAAVEFRSGNLVALSQGVAGAATKADVAAVARTEYSHLRSVGSGFSLSVTSHPVLATALWAAGAVALAALAALGPLGLGRLRRRRQQRRQEELDRIVRGHAITKRRRVQG